MIKLHYPQPAFRIKSENGKELIFDTCRKLWVQLTPEEWVRQNFLNYLMEVKQYPCSLIAVEREIRLGDVKKRFDIVVFKNAAPWMLVECKEMEEQISEDTLKQILSYNTALQAEYLVVTNGKSTFAVRLHANGFQWLDELPLFAENS